MKTQRLLSLAIMFPLSACVVVSGGTDSSTDGNSTSSTSTAADTESSGATVIGGTGSDTNSTGSTTADVTATDPTSTTDPTMGSSTADSDSDTGGDPDAILESCEAACEVLFDCYPDDFDSLELCVALCVYDSVPPETDAACEAAYIAYNECLGGASCDDLEGRDLCLAEEELLDDLCPDNECIVGSSGDQEECEFIYECPGEFLNELRCTVDACECFEDGVKTLECDPMMNVCADFDMSALEDYAFVCCGW